VGGSGVWSVPAHRLGVRKVRSGKGKTENELRERFAEPQPTGRRTEGGSRGGGGGNQLLTKERAERREEIEWTY